MDFSALASDCYSWYGADSSPSHDVRIAETRDVFQARLDRFYQDVIPKLDIEAGSLLTAIIGEIGNNSFDHNLGQWRDIPGCWFEYRVSEQSVFCQLADRGQGVRASLQRIVPTLTSDQEAVEVAFYKSISGRAPEKRGNGLKFVRGVIEKGNKRLLIFLSGAGKIIIGDEKDARTQDYKVLLSRVQGKGVFSLLDWSRV